jgi:hypothetical protein
LALTGAPPFGDRPCGVASHLMQTAGLPSQNTLRLVGGNAAPPILILKILLAEL